MIVRLLIGIKEKDKINKECEWIKKIDINGIGGMSKGNVNSNFVWWGFGYGGSMGNKIDGRNCRGVNRG